MIEPTGFADGLDVTCETEWSRGNPPPRFLVRAPGRVETEGKLGKDGVLGGAQMWAC